MKNVLVIEEHSDDSAIGACGYLRKRRLAGDQPRFLAVAMSDLNLIHCGQAPREKRLREYEEYVTQMGGSLVDGFSTFDATRAWT